MILSYYFLYYTRAKLTVPDITMRVNRSIPTDLLGESSLNYLVSALLHNRVLCENSVGQKKPHSQPHMVLPPTFKERPAEAPIYRVVLTGGPCGGKTTAITVT